MIISFVIPTYNRADSVGATIESVLTQPYPHCEAVVVDDGSTDNLSNTLREFGREARVQLIRFARNRGQNVARNRGIEAARGDIVSILDSDDIDMGTDLTPLARLFESKPHLLGVFTGTISRSRRAPMGRMDTAGIEFGYQGFLDGTYSGEYQPFLRKEGLSQPVFEENLGIKRSCTQLTWLRLGQHGVFEILDLPTRLYDDVRPDRMGNIDNLIRDAREVERCFSLTLERFGPLIRNTARPAYHDLLFRKSFYSLLGGKRREAYRTLLAIPPVELGLGRYFGLAAAVLVGPRLARWTRRHLT